MYVFRYWKVKKTKVFSYVITCSWTTLAGKLSLLVELHWVLRDWRVAVMDQKVDGSHPHFWHGGSHKLYSTNISIYK